MKELINKILFYLKLIFLLISFSIIMYILFMMYDDYNTGIISILLMFIPLFLVLVIFVVSFFFKEGHNHTMFNVASFLSLLAIFIISFRTLFDKNMVLWAKDGMNYYFFQNQMMQIKILCYAIFLGNILLIYQEKKDLKEKMHS